ncbi:PAS domain S-box protein [Pedobacter petrophilus]|uniref:histidine kinase n=1 Tax=Pedobacter petrophilus TaxID=1908241 RepID=A0A7K0FZC5_9SPHI|nr:ATP-binding protein [Pedobacter petrophilus]MRX76329.1 PAS domain S-box protein [Pedobacter petrophilus]
MEKSKEVLQLEAANRELQIQLEEANDIIHAIRSGEVDALVVNGKDGHQLFTLKSADQTYRIFIEQMTESALTLDQDGRILYCNSRFATLCTVPLEKVIGMKLLDFVLEEDWIFAQDVIDAAWEIDTRTELNLINSEQEKITVQLSLKALDLDEGTALSIIITDLTELKKHQLLLQVRNEQLEEARQVADQLNSNLENIVSLRTAELELKNDELKIANGYQRKMNTELSIALERLKESDENLQSAFNAGELGSCRVDLTTGKADMSPRFRLLYGLPEDEEIDWAMVVSAIEPEYVAEVTRVLEACATSGTPLDSTYPIRHLASGERRWMRVVGKVKTDKDGNFASVYAVIMDVTAQKQDEQRKNDFIAMVSHELKTPLTSMKGYIQVMQLKAKGNDNAFAVKALDGAERQITKMTNMINGFLNISRFESGKMVIELQRVELSAIVEEIIEEYITTGSNHEIAYNCLPGLFINADQNKLGHVINNLIGNAVKYSPFHSKITIDCLACDQNAIFKIKDQGMGIPKDDLPKLFERFYRVESSQMATVSGFGIGLYLSAEIVTRHYGKIWVESEIGIGSTFYFSIPLDRD